MKLPDNSIGTEVDAYANCSRTGQLPSAVKQSRSNWFTPDPDALGFRNSGKAKNKTCTHIRSLGEITTHYGASRMTPRRSAQRQGCSPTPVTQMTLTSSSSGGCSAATENCQRWIHHFRYADASPVVLREHSVHHQAVTRELQTSTGSC